MSRSVVEMETVRKVFHAGEKSVRALNDISFSAETGEFVTVVGPSGSGKSTLLMLLGLLDTPTDGRITFRGTDVSTFSRRERTRIRKETIGFVFQSYGLLPALTALENVATPRLLDSDTTETERRARRLLELVGLGDRLHHYPNELSGGQQQRVAVARALVNEPSVVLADEPTGNLDRETGEQVLTELLEAIDDDVSVIAVTHDEYVAGLSDRAVRLVDGNVQTRAEGSP